MRKISKKHVPMLVVALMGSHGSLAVARTVVSSAEATIQAEDYDNEQGVRTDLTRDSVPGTYVGWINDGDYTEYDLNVRQGGSYEVTARVSSQTDGGEITLRTDRGTVGSLDVGNTGNWQRWELVSTTVRLEAGRQRLRLDYTGDSRYLLNIDWFTVQPSDTATASLGNCPGDIQDCIDTAADDGGGAVRLDAKTYYLTEKLELASDVDLIGQGSQTVVTWDPSVADSIDEPLMYRGRGGDGIRNVEIKDMSILCTVDTSDRRDRDRTNHMAIFIDGWGDPADARSLQHENIDLENLDVRDCGGIGIHIKGANDVSADGLFMSGNGWFTEDLLHNIYYLRVRNADIRNSVFINSPAGHGMRMGSIVNANFENLVVEGNADHGIHMNSVENLTGSGITSRNNCVVPLGACRDVACYGDCDFDFD